MHIKVSLIDKKLSINYHPLGYYGLGDSQIEYQILDRQSFKQFFGLESGDKVTDASVHDSQPLDDLLTVNDYGQDFYADSAYTGEEQEKVIEKHGLKNLVNEKGYRNKPLTEEQKHNNKVKSKTRARVEHVFGFMEQSMHGLSLRSIGITRATGIIGLINLTYNLFRYEQIVRLK